MDNGRMARDVEVLQQVMETHDLTVKALANRSGFAEKSIYKYLSEVRTLPSEVLRAAFDLTYDSRLVMLITGSARVEIVLHTEPAGDSSHNTRPARPPISTQPLQETLPGMLHCLREATRGTQHLYDIMKDGVVDLHDLAHIAKFQECMAEVRKWIAITDASVESERERIVGCQQ